VISGLRLRRLLLAAGLPLLLAVAGSGAVRADDDIDYEDIAKNQGLSCLHPTVRTERAEVERLAPPRTEGDVTTTRLKMYYQCLIRRNNVEFDIMVRQAGSIRQMMVRVLSDTAPSTLPCALTSRWVDF